MGRMAEVEIDPETGKTVVDRYVVVDDFGNLINPLLAKVRCTAVSHRA